MKKQVAQLRALQMGVVARFPVERRGRTVGGIAVWSEAGLRAWLDVCPHRGNSVDSVTIKGLLECTSHGAIYDPASGLCVDGPCPGASLAALQCGTEGEKVWVDDAEPEEPYDDTEA